VISKADKGSAVVIQNRIDYVNKIMVILGDKSKFTLLESDPTIKREAALQRKLLKLKNAGNISEEDYKKIRPTGLGPSILYGSCKVHTNKEPNRPVIRTIKTYIYCLGKWIDELIKPIKPVSRHPLRDTIEFCEKVKKFKKRHKGCHMGSNDVVNLYTCIPTNETIIEYAMKLLVSAIVNITKN
jgi:hypothetical protein